jgi:hypothetical protein
MELKVIVPNELNEITLAQYKKYLDLVEANKEDQNADTFISMKMLEIFCGVPYEQTKGLRFKDVANIVGILSDMLNSNPELVKTFKIGDTEFGFIPDLEDMSFGEYVDLDTTIGDWSKMHLAMAVLYRPVVQKHGKLYRIAEYEPEKYEEAMKHTPMDAVISSLVFFYNLGIELSKAMMNYLEGKEKEALVQSLPLAESGVGISQFMDSLEETLQGLNISHHKGSTNA